MELITTPTLNSNKIHAYIVLIEDRAAACPITGQILEIPPHISPIKFVIEPGWFGVTNAFRTQYGFRDLNSKYNLFATSCFSERTTTSLGC